MYRYGSTGMSCSSFISMHAELKSVTSRDVRDKESALIITMTPISRGKVVSEPPLEK